MSLIRVFNERKPQGWSRWGACWCSTLHEGNVETHCTSVDVIYWVMKRSNVCPLFPARERRLKAHCLQPPLPLYLYTSAKANPKPLRNASVLVQGKMQSPQRSPCLLWFVRSYVLCSLEWILKAELLQSPLWSCASSSLVALPPETRVSLGIFIASKYFQPL